MPAYLVRTLWIVSALAHIACSEATATDRPPPPALAGDKIPDYSGTTSKLLRINPDWTSEELETRRITILGQSAIRQKTIQRFSYTASLDHLEVVEAVTEKADGRKIPVPSSSIVIQDLRWNSDVEESLDTHDFKQQVIFFPDVAVGDSVVARVRKSSRTAFPGQYIATIPADEELRQSLTIQFKRSHPLYIGVQGDGFTDTVTTDDETETHAISYRGKTQNYADEPGSILPRDMSPQIHVTSMEDYQALGRALWRAWSPRLEITPEITALAEEITHGIANKRLQAEAIDLWIKRNIRYAWIAIGSEALLPDHVGRVLSNRFGHCANRAALMSALLTVSGIENEFVLIKKLGTEFSLPTVAAYAFDHVLLYLPELQIYAEPTSIQAGFGVLDSREYDKPVVYFSAKGSRVGRIPVAQPTDHMLINRTKITVAADGTVSGQTVESSTGFEAMNARKLAVALPPLGSRLEAAALLRKNETPGEGRFEPENPGNLSDPFVIRSQFTLAKKMDTSPAATWSIPDGLVLKDSSVEKEQSLTEGYFDERYENRRFPFLCEAGSSKQEIDITFAEGLPLPKPLKGLDLKTSVFSYSSVYRLENRTLKVLREFVSYPPSRICSPGIEAEIAAPLKAVEEDQEREISFPHQKRISSRDAKRIGKNLSAVR